MRYVLIVTFLIFFAVSCSTYSVSVPSLTEMESQLDQMHAYDLVYNRTVQVVQWLNNKGLLDRDQYSYVRLYLDYAYTHYYTAITLAGRGDYIGFSAHYEVAMFTLYQIESYLKELVKDRSL